MEPLIVGMVSIGSRAWTSDGHRAAANWCLKAKCRYEVVVLDSGEITNRVIFARVGYDEAAALVTRLASEARQDALSSGADRCVVASALLALEAAKDLRRALTDLRDASRSFRNHLCSQTFSNLRPKFRRIGVDSKAAPEVLEATTYLVDELVIKMLYINDPACIGEVSPHPEMEITRALVTGKYGTRFASTRRDYCELRLEADRLLASSFFRPVSASR